MSEINFDPGRLAAFEEMQGVWKRQYESLAILKETAKTILGYTSLFLGLLSVLQISNFFSSPSVIYKWLGGAAAASYICLVWLCLTIIAPTEVYAPIDSEWDVLAEYLFDKSGDALLEQRIVSYLGVIKDNDIVLAKRSAMLKWAGRLFAAIVLLLFLMGLAA